MVSTLVMASPDGGMMHTLKTIKLSVDLINEDKDPIGGQIFYWTEGAHVVLIQSWEYRASGPVYGPINPDPMSGDNLLTYFIECWNKNRAPGIEVSAMNVEICN